MLFSVWFLAFSLSVDAVAAAVCCGLSCPDFRWRDGVWLGCWFGGFQGGMTLIGALLGDQLSEHFQLAGGVAAFGLLVYLGGRMLLDAMRPLEECVLTYDLSCKTVATLAVATSLDALAVGVSLGWLNAGLWSSAAIIGGVTFTLTLLGSVLGGQVGQRFHRWASAAGGLVLIGMGIRILSQIMR